MGKGKKRRRREIAETVDLLDGHGLGQLPHAVEDAVSACVSVDSENEIASGVCVSPDGFILTAAHVAPNLGDVRKVAFQDGAIFEARCVSLFSACDLALLAIKSRKFFPCISTLSFMNDSGRVTKNCTSKYGKPPGVIKFKRKEKTVYCVGQPGRPRGERLEIVRGEIKSVVKENVCIDDPDGNSGQFEAGKITHDCPVFCGNSGSPLIDNCGYLCGLHTEHDLSNYKHYATKGEDIAIFLMANHLPVSIPDSDSDLGIPQWACLSEAEGFIEKHA